jgi:PBP1b-binding outer membrane lipoprotein LpoB
MDILYQEREMKKLIIIVCIAFVLSGCAGWARLGTTDKQDHRQDQSQKQYNEHAND